MVSIIIRTNNEERWIALCLESIFKQDYKDFEVVVVDNKSTDKTLAKVKGYNARIINIDDYLPGRALNLGIAASRGEHICSLSGHCIPVNAQWLGNLVRNLENSELAGVYGRQEPMAFTSNFDKRDMINLFGLDRKIQIKDSFFHNANSIIRRDIWEQIPFDEQVTNIEDRVWAKKVLAAGYKIGYEPEARVYHYHGIHQDNDAQRCHNVVKILESLELKDTKKLDIENLNIVTLIPIKGPVQYLNGRPLLEYTIEKCRQSRFIKRIIVSTDSPETAAVAKRSGAEAPFLREKELSQEHVDLEQVLQFSLEEIEKLNIYPDLLVILEATYPFRQNGLIDNMLQQLIDKGLDSVIPVRAEYKSCWRNKDNRMERIDAGFIPRAIKEPLYVGLIGLACVTHPVFIREGRRLGEKIGFVQVRDPYSSIEVRHQADLELNDKIMAEWWKKNK
jgi:CMP-N-acetylneuraminic acid synthetase